jgi:integrase
LTPHGSGFWQKKIRNKTHYFGRWGKRVGGVMVRLPDDGWKEALDLYRQQAEALHAGRTPRAPGDCLTLANLLNHFRSTKQKQLQAGELSARMYGEYTATCDLLNATFPGRIVDDLVAADFEKLRALMAERWGPVRLSNEVQKVRTVFKYGYESGLITQPVRFGPTFKKPSASVLRRHRAKNGERMLEPEQLRKLIDAAQPPLKAMVLLGLNAGFGPHDIATLPQGAVDLERGWLSYARPKTGVARRCPLWAETVEALREALAARPKPKQVEAAGLMFVTSRGRPWLSGGIANPVSVAVRDSMKAVGIHGEGIGAYTLRHVHRTVSDSCRDQRAADLIMGHTPTGISAAYVERVEDERLLRITRHIHDWLFGPSDPAGGIPDEPEAAAEPAPEPRPTAAPPVFKLRLYSA